MILQSKEDVIKFRENKSISIPTKSEVIPVANPVEVVSSKENTGLTNDALASLTGGIYGKKGFSGRFIQNIYRDTILTPHEEMFRCRKAYDYNVYISTASDTLNNFIICGNTMFKTSDEKLEDTINEIYKEVGLKDIYENYLVSDCVNVGNGYSERLFSVKDKKRIVKYKYVESPERIYIDFIDNKVKRYILEVPEMFGDSRAKFEYINYYGTTYKRGVYGIEIPVENLFHIKIRKNTIPIYGRGYIATITNDYEVAKELERDTAVLARNKAVKKTIMQLEGAKDRELMEMSTNLSSLSDIENGLTGYPGKINLFPLNAPDNISDIIPLIDNNKRKLTLGMSPEFLLHGEETNRSTGREQKLGYELSIATIRNSLSTFMVNEMKLVLERLGITPPEDLDFAHGDFEQYDEEGVKEKFTDGWREGIVTLNEVRQVYGLPEDPEKGDLYKYELLRDQVKNTGESFSEFRSRVRNKILALEKIDINSPEGSMLSEQDLSLLEKHISPELDDKARKQFNELLKWYLKGSFKYIWRTVGDEKVRSTHRKRDGKEYYILKALKLEEEFPGWAGNCRCVPEIIKRKKKR